MALHSYVSFVSIFGAHLVSRYSGHYRGGHDPAGRQVKYGSRQEILYHDATLTKIGKTINISFPTNR